MRVAPTGKSSKRGKSNPGRTATMRIISSNVVVDQETSTLPPSTASSHSYENAKKSASDCNGLTSSSSQRIAVPKDAFVTIKADTGKHPGRFRILPYSRELNAKYSGAADKLSEFIKRGGGLVVEGQDKGQLSPSESQAEIKILDMEYVRANIRETQDMILPYDCFSSNFIWNQIYQRSNSNGQTEKRDANLNLFRISPSAHVNYDANGIFQGAVTWNDIQPIPSDKLLPAIPVKEVALQFFPEQIVCSRRGWSSRTRRVYSKQESQTLLDQVCEVDGHDRVTGVSLYKEIIETHAINRTVPSLKEHFLKTILPHIIAGDDYYTITTEDSEKFNTLFGKRVRKQAQEDISRKRARQGKDSND